MKKVKNKLYKRKIIYKFRKIMNKIQQNSNNKIFKILMRFLKKYKLYKINRKLKL